MRHLPRHSDHEVGVEKRPRKGATYFGDYCCKGCFFNWGLGWHRTHRHKHGSAEDNYNGTLKKYWKPSDYWAQEDVE